VPVRVCAGAAPDSGPSELPRDVCPVVQAALQRLRTGPLAERLDAVVVPTTCDWKVQAAGRIQGDLPVYRVELSRTEAPDGLAGELRRLAGELAEITDLSLTSASLLRAVALTKRARDAHRQIETLRRRALPPISGCEAMLVADCYGYGDLAGWTAACEALATALADESPGEPAASRPRVVLTGSPVIWPNFKVPSLVEDTGGVVVADDFCSRSSRLAFPDLQPGSIGDMLAGLARRAIEPCTCGTIPRTEARAQALPAQVRRLDADGVVCHYLRGCAPIAATQGAVVRALREAGVPALTVETDAGQEDIEGLRTRIEAFVEMTGKRDT
jgi:benzoyl-CoA reductase/2-hydroxyglutaryl-CoA dehydratase subunit BcrC/BadD/HgdB